MQRPRSKSYIHQPATVYATATYVVRECPCICSSLQFPVHGRVVMCKARHARELSEANSQGDSLRASKCRTCSSALWRFTFEKSLPLRGHSLVCRTISLTNNRFTWCELNFLFPYSPSHEQFLQSTWKTAWKNRQPEQCTRPQCR